MLARTRAALVVVLIAMAAGCEEEGDPPERSTPAEYAEAFCTAFGDFVDNVGPAVERLADLDDDSSQAERREAFEDWLVSWEDALIPVVGELRRIDAPAVPDGEQLHSGFVEAFDGIRSVIAELRADLAGIPDDEFSQRITELTGDLDEALAALGDDEDDEETPRLDRAFDRNETCQAMEAEMEDVGG